jgi:hypothetical protein
MVGIAALAVLLPLVLAPSALAQPVFTSQTLNSVPNSGLDYTLRLGGDTGLQTVDFQLVAAPSAFQFVPTFMVTVNGASLPNPCHPLTQVTAPSFQCSFANGEVNVGDLLSITAYTTPMVPVGTGAYVVLGDWAGHTASSTLSVTSGSTTPGKPFVTDASLTGTRRAKPRFRFTLHEGQNAPEIKRFTLGFPRGLSVPPQPPTMGFNFEGGKWECNRAAKEKLVCDAKKPVKLTTATIRFPAIVESRALEHRIQEQPTTELSFRLKITDVRRWRRY